jgi:hypothetical protein
MPPPFLPRTRPLRRASGEELPDWLLFSPSFFETRSPAPGRFSSVSSVCSFVDVARGHDKGKTLVLEGGSGSAGSSPVKGKASVKGASSSRSSPPPSPLPHMFDTFMTDVRRAHQCRGATPASPACSRGGEGGLEGGLQAQRVVQGGTPPPPPLPSHRPVPADLVGRCFNCL